MDHQPRPTYKPKLFERLLDRLPSLIGALNLDALRVELRQYNLHDTYPSGAAQGTQHTDPVPIQFEGARNSDGKFNSTEMPRMGCSGMRFGRNFPRHLSVKPTEEELWTPNPRMISERFMTRTEFKPATTLNLLAAAWIQFQTHDWFVHEESDDQFDIPLPEGDTWPHGSMTLNKTKPDEILSETDVKCPAYKNLNIAWWDGSQIYGSNETITSTLRTKSEDGKLLLTKSRLEQFLPRDPNNLPMTGFNNNWWLGMEILHTLFALEHNSICDMLRAKHPTWKGTEIFDRARLINSALMAKIHTVEWTPAILAHPTLKIAMNANWWGLVGETLTKLLGRFPTSSEAISGIPGSEVNQFGVPYSLTEEFVSVYRMHSLIPDSITFRHAPDDSVSHTFPIEDVAFTNAQSPFLEYNLSFADVFYTFGTSLPGAITPNNHPSFLCNLPLPNPATTSHPQTIDLATVDLLRDRERAIPRFNTFRRLLRLPPYPTFTALCASHPHLTTSLSAAYNNDIELVDAQIGMLVEPRPEGFGFGDTAFRMFILMASRRLKSDRFIAGKKWGREGYGDEGVKWVQDNGMKSVLERHFPVLRGKMGGGNVFAP